MEGHEKRAHFLRFHLFLSIFPLVFGDVFAISTQAPTQEKAIYNILNLCSGEIALRRGPQVHQVLIYDAFWSGFHVVPCVFDASSMTFR